MLSCMSRSWFELQGNEWDLWRRNVQDLFQGRLDPCRWLLRCALRSIRTVHCGRQQSCLDLSCGSLLKLTNRHRMSIRWKSALGPYVGLSAIRAVTSAPDIGLTLVLREFVKSVKRPWVAGVVEKVRMEGCVCQVVQFSRYDIYLRLWSLP